MKKTLLYILLSVLILCGAVTGVSVVLCRTQIAVTEYEAVVEGLQGEAKIVLISDLHGMSFGTKNVRLLTLTAEQKPDAIFVAGDMINEDADGEELGEFLELLERLGNIAPVYFSPGNKEMDYILEKDEGLIGKITDTGAVYLCDSFTETEIAGSTVRVGGSLGHFYNYSWSAETRRNPPDYAMEKEIGSTGVPALVMLHMPESIVLDRAALEWTGDLYLCGHTHGGVIRIPGIGGLFAPAQGYFPEYDRGSFTVWDRELIIGAGLAGYGVIPRAFNMPEICVITLKSAPSE
ncbi:MAG: metallophosphoesterase [Oscillospiraceae bacterium]|nr:metallophosphoesterase [Oscillospiraceae bacterium]